MKRTTLYVDDAAYRRLKRLGRLKGVPPAQLVREAVAQYLATQEIPRVPKSLGAFRSGRHDLSERAEELLTGFGTSP